MSHDVNPMEQARSVLQNPTAIRALLQSQQARQLIAMLREQGDLNEAARQARQGDTHALQTMVEQVGRSREGEQVLSALRQQMSDT